VNPWIRGRAVRDSDQTAYMTPNSRIPDIGIHGRGFYASRSPLSHGGRMHAMLDGSRGHDDRFDRPRFATHALFRETSRKSWNSHD